MVRIYATIYRYRYIYIYKYKSVLLGGFVYCDPVVFLLVFLFPVYREREGNVFTSGLQNYQHTPIKSKKRIKI